MFRTHTALVLVALCIGAASCSSSSTSANTTAVVTSIAPTSIAPTSIAPTPTPTAAAAPITTAPVTTNSPGAGPVPTTSVTATTTGAATSATATTSAPTATATPKVLEVLVTNDDGYGAPGIDAIVQYLSTRSDMHVSVWAPLTNQSGAGDRTTPGAAPAVTDVKTASGYPARAVAGTPADSVDAALNGGMAVKPDLIISGSNLGQNYGPLTSVSGTVGAAATGARTGVHAIAISQGAPAAGGQYDFPASVTVLTGYLDANIAAYRAGTSKVLVSINVPTCPVGVAILPTIDDLPSATAANGRVLGAPTACDGNPAEQVDDIDAFDAGHPVVTQIDPITLIGVVVTP